MKLMDRYIVKELIVPFILGSLAIALLFDANQLIYILKSFNTQVVPVPAMAQMIIYHTPHWLNLTLPAGISLAGSLAITRMARESEITAMRVVGVRVTRIILPVAVFGLVVGFGNYLIAEKVIPRTEPKAKKLEIETAVASSGPRFQSNVWLTLKQYHAALGTIEAQPDGSLLIRDIVLGERPTGDTVNFLIAPSGVYRDGAWTIDHPMTWSVSPQSQQITPMQADRIIIQQPFSLDDLGVGSAAEDKTADQLLEQIRAGRAAKRDMTNEEITYYTRFSIPAACIIFSIIAPIFAMIYARTGSFVGVLLSTILVLVYYNAHIISTEIFGKSHWLSPWLSAWLPNIVFACLGLLAARKLE